MGTLLDRRTTLPTWVKALVKGHLDRWNYMYNVALGRTATLIEKEPLTEMLSLYVKHSRLPLFKEWL